MMQLLKLKVTFVIMLGLRHKTGCDRSIARFTHHQEKSFTRVRADLCHDSIEVGSQYLLQCISQIQAVSLPRITSRLVPHIYLVL